MNMHEIQEKKEKELGKLLDGYYISKESGIEEIKSLLSTAISEAWDAAIEKATKNAVEYMDLVDYENFLSTLKN